MGKDITSVRSSLYRSDSYTFKRQKVQARTALKSFCPLPLYWIKWNKRVFTGDSRKRKRVPFPPLISNWAFAQVSNAKWKQGNDCHPRYIPKAILVANG